MIERRGFIGRLFGLLGFGLGAGAGAGATSQAAAKTQEFAAEPLKATWSVSPLIRGVGVLHRPDGVYLDEDFKAVAACDVAKKMAEEIKVGSVLVLPSTRAPDTGALLWDFRIEGGDPGQVRVERQEQLAAADAMAEIWGMLCPDCGPEDYPAIVEAVRKLQVEAGRRWAREAGEKLAREP